MEAVCGEGLQWRSRLGDVIVGACVGGDGGFVGRKEGGEGGNGNVAEWGVRWRSEGEGVAKMVGEGGDEGGVEIVLGEVLFVISEEDPGDGGKVIVWFGEGLDRHVSREVGWGTKGQL